MAKIAVLCAIVLLIVVIFLPKLFGPHYQDFVWVEFAINGCFDLKIAFYVNILVVNGCLYVDYLVSLRWASLATRWLSTAAALTA